MTIRAKRARVSFRQREVVLDMHGRKCAYCGIDIIGKNYHIDHIVPFSKCEENDVYNLVPTCVSCNMIKKDKSLEEFRQIMCKKAGMKDYVFEFEKTNKVDVSVLSYYQAIYK